MLKKIYKNNIINSIHYYKIFTFVNANLILAGGNLINLSGFQPVLYSIIINIAYNLIVILISVVRFNCINWLDCLEKF